MVVHTISSDVFLQFPVAVIAIKVIIVQHVLAPNVLRELELHPASS